MTANDTQDPRIQIGKDRLRDHVLLTLENAIKERDRRKQDFLLALQTSFRTAMTQDAEGMLRDDYIRDYFHQTFESVITAEDTLEALRKAHQWGETMLRKFAYASDRQTHMERARKDAHFCALHYYVNTVAELILDAEAG